MIKNATEALYNYFYPTNKNTKLDDVTLLATIALLATYPEGTRIGIINHHEVAIQEPNKLNINLPYLGEVCLGDSQSMARRYNGNGRAEACIFDKTITNGINENRSRTDYKKLCNLAKDEFIKYITPFLDEEDNAAIVFQKTRDTLLNYTDKAIQNPQKFDEKSYQKWDDEELNTLVSFIEKAQNEDKNMKIRPAREAAITYLAKRHLQIESRLKEELTNSQK